MRIQSDFHENPAGSGAAGGPVVKRGYSDLKRHLPAALLACLGLSACGGAVSNLGNVTPGGQGPTTGKGLFRDSNVAGLEYRSGETTGVTPFEDNLTLTGEFTYETDAGITFFLGGVTLGTTAGQALLTPVHLIANGSNTSNTQVQNIARFLQMLDNNGNPDDGIVISEAVRTVAQNWPQVNFLAADFDAEMTDIMSDVASVDERTPVLPDAVTAKTHLDATLLCSYSGGFGGTYQDTSGVIGRFGFLVNGRSGNLSGHIFRNGGTVVTPIAGTIPLRFDGQNLGGISVTGRTPEADEFTFQFTNLDQIDGNWQNSSTSQQGTFTGVRINVSQTPIYLFTGTFSGDDDGIVSFGVLRDSAGDLNSINGEIYKPTIDQLTNFNGRVIGQENAAIRSMDVTAGDVKNFVGNIDFNSLTVTGTWTQNISATQVQSGTYTATGCRLN